MLHSDKKKKFSRAKCIGSNQKPRIIIDNDWYIGKSGICPTCFRNICLKKKDKEYVQLIPTHYITS